MRSYWLTIGLAVFLPAAVTSAGDPSLEQQGLALAQRADAENAGFGTDRSVLSMELVDAQGESTTRRLVIEVIEGKADGDRSRATFEWPADVKGTKLLTWTHKRAEDDQWLFLPAIKRVKRISSSNKSGSFMGSEFAYEDLSTYEVDKYSYKLLGTTIYANRASYQLERFPVDTNSGYKRQVVWLDKEYWNPLRIDFYDRKDELLKTGSFSDYRKFGKLWRAQQIVMSNVQTKKKSRLTWVDRKLGVALDAALFEPTSLED
jgi:outer membrane lipoprotein-sorting protein